jgi:hypothetical protein
MRISSIRSALPCWALADDGISLLLDRQDIGGARDMIFTNPSGAPELACNECGCRWFDRMANRCYECGAQVSPADVAEFEKALNDFRARLETRR